MESTINRPAVVWLAQIMLGLTALLIICLPLLTVYSANKTFEYYGITPSQAQGQLTTRFVTSLFFQIPPLIAIAFASWGMVKGNRTGRLLTICVFTYTAITLALDPLWPNEVLQFSEYTTSIPLWAEIIIKLLLAAFCAYLVYSIGYSRSAKLYFARPLLARHLDPPPPPSFDD